MKSMEKILKIEQVNNERIGKWDNCDGYIIITDKQNIKLLIDNEQCCCENWGYFMSEDDLESFIGTNIISIEVTNTCYNTNKLEKCRLLYEGELDLECGDIMFVNINTNKGLFQFVAYNSHNGYYGHTAYVFSEQLNHEEIL